MTMTHEKIQKAHEEDTNYILEQYREWQKLPEEQQETKLQDKNDPVAVSRAWLNSEERKQFDMQYAEFQKQRNQNPTAETPQMQQPL